MKHSSNPSNQILNWESQSHFPMEKLLRKSTPKDCTNQGYLFLTIFQLGNGSAIHGSKSDVWDETSAMVS